MVKRLELFYISKKWTCLINHIQPEKVSESGFFLYNNIIRPTSLSFQINIAEEIHSSWKSFLPVNKEWQWETPFLFLHCSSFACRNLDRSHRWCRRWWETSLRYLWPLQPAVQKNHSKTWARKFIFSVWNN